MYYVYVYLETSENVINSPTTQMASFDEPTCNDEVIMSNLCPKYANNFHCLLLCSIINILVNVIVTIREACNSNPQLQNFIKVWHTFLLAHVKLYVFPFSARSIEPIS